MVALVKGEWQPFNFGPTSPSTSGTPTTGHDGDAASSTFASHPDSVPPKKGNKSARSSTASERKPKMSSDPRASRRTGGRITKLSSVNSTATSKFGGTSFTRGRDLVDGTKKKVKPLKKHHGTLRSCRY